MTKNVWTVRFQTEDGATVGTSIVDVGAIQARGGCEFREVATQRERVMRARDEFVIVVWEDNR